MKRKNSFTYLVALLVGLTMFVSCGQAPQSSDIVQKEQQEKILAEGSAQVGMPAIKNFRERKIVKDLYELRDQNGLVTYTYIFSEYTGKYTYLGETIGYGIPYATQFTNPTKVSENGYGSVINQADPNGLFTPSSAEGTWVMMLDPVSHEVMPQYIESRISVFTYKLPAGLVIAGYDKDAPPSKLKEFIKENPTGKKEKTNKK